MVDRNISVLVADDDASLRNAVAEKLGEAGYLCSTAEDGLEAVQLFDRVRPGIVVLDVMMPKMDGYEVCEHIRSKDAQVGVLMLSARSEIVDKKIGFRMGADDYLAKPFDSDELLMRVDAMARRYLAVTQAVVDAAPQGSAGIIHLGDLEIDQRRLEVRVRGARADLTPKECLIVQLLAEHEGEIFSKEDIIRALWGEEYLDTSISIAVYVRKIREKIEDDPAQPRYLHTVWGYGYRMVDLQQ